MDVYTDSKLYNAMDANDVCTLKQLLTSGQQDVDEFFYDPITDESVSLLHLACIKGRRDCVRVFVDKNVVMNVADQYGRTPLMYALSNLNMEVAELLLQENQDLSTDEDSNGFTAFDLAAIDGNADAVRLLAKYGADVNHRTFDGETPLMRCVKIGTTRDPSQVLWALIEAGADVNVKDRKCRRSALHNMCTYCLTLQLACLKKDVRSAEVLLSAGADMHSLDCGAKTPLTNMLLQHVRKRDGFLFVHEDIWTILLMMVHAGIDYNHSICEDADPLLTAALLRAEPLIRFFLANGADPNIRTKLGVTTLLKSVSRNDLPSVKTLIEWNCRMDIPGQHYRRREDVDYTVDPYELAIMLGHLDIARFLIKAGYPHYKKPYLFDKAPLPDALEADVDFLDWLMEKCSEPEPLSVLAVFAVRRATRLGIVEAARQLPIPPSLKRRVVLKDFLQLDVDY